ncbi:MAG: integrase, partial [Proteobacteria bacterium]|nr:integrase [Pseudomonadota bacterium]
GATLPLIGALLGHTQVQTTQRYAHLADDPLREATARVGAVVMGSGVAEVVKIERG